MSIQSSMKAVEIWEKKEGQDEWGAPTQEEVLVSTIQCAINHAQGTNISKDINYSEITHIGLTSDKSLKKGQVLKTSTSTYVIDKPPNNITRLTQLYLKEVM